MLACPAPSLLQFTGAGLRSTEGASQGLGGTSAARNSPSPPTPSARAVRSLSGDPALLPHLGTWAPGWARVSLHKAPRPAAPSLPWEGCSPQGGHCRGTGSRLHLGIVRWQDHWGGPGWGWQTAARLGLGCSSTIPTEGAWPGTQGKAPLAPLASAPPALPHPREGLSWPGGPTAPLFADLHLRSDPPGKGRRDCMPPTRRGTLSFLPTGLARVGTPGDQSPGTTSNLLWKVGVCLLTSEPFKVLCFHSTLGQVGVLAQRPPPTHPHPPRAARSPGVKLHPES